MGVISWVRMSLILSPPSYPSPLKGEGTLMFAALTIRENMLRLKGGVSAVPEVKPE